MKHLTIKNWHKFQHYKDRNPPWIKLHYEILTSPDWVMVDDASKLLAVVCMMLASRNNGQIPLDAQYIQRVAHLNETPDFKPLIKAGFFSDASTLLADASTKTEAEAEAKGEKKEEEKEKNLIKKRKTKTTLAEWEATNGQLSPAHVPTLTAKHGEKAVARIIGRFRASCDAHGYQYADFAAAVRSWRWDESELKATGTTPSWQKDPFNP